MDAKVELSAADSPWDLFISAYNDSERVRSVIFDFDLDDADLQAIVTLDQKASSFFDHRDPSMVKSLSTRRI